MTLYAVLLQVAVAERRMWCQFFARCWGGCGQNVLEMFMLHPASFTHLLLHTSLKAHTCLQMKPMKAKELLKTGAETGDSCKEHVCRIFYQQSAPHTPASVLFFWNMLNCIVNQLLSLSNLKHIQMLSVFPVNDVNSTLYESYSNQKSNFVIVLVSIKE